MTSHTPVYPDPQQLASQAETISGLIKQRDLLLQDRDDDHKRWQAERDGWDRMAEALIGKRRAAVRAGIDDVSVHSSIEIGRSCASRALSWSPTPLVGASMGKPCAESSVSVVSFCEQRKFGEFTNVFCSHPSLRGRY